LDEARIHVRSGKGGDGLISFNRTRRTPKGTPDGGNGGAGGDVWIRATRSMNTLLHFHHQIHHKAGDGTPGGPNNRAGARGRDLTVEVPVGTIVRDLHTEAMLADLTEEGQRFLVCRGGRGGRGNRAFTRSTRQAPRIRELGEPAEERWLKLELRLLADVGLVGLPNAGKSTLTSRISRVRAKVAAYPFTTLVPNLGAVEAAGGSFVVADLPGLIKGAHEGRGLGDRFLRHATRARLLVHLVDLAPPAGRDPYDDYRTIRGELEAWEELRHVPEIVVGTKADLLSSQSVDKVVRRFAGHGIVLRPISSITGEGIGELLKTLAEELAKPAPVCEPDGPTRRDWELTPEERTFSVDEENGQLVVRGRAVESLVRRLDMASADAGDYLEEQLDRMGVMAALRRRGLSPGDKVRIGGVELEFGR